MTFAQQATRLHALIVISMVTIGATEAIAQSQSPANEPLQWRVNALAQQVDLRYRGDRTELRDQRSRIERVLAKWNALANPLAADRERLTRWLDDAILATMPGRDGRLPDAPRLIGGAAVARNANPSADASNGASRHGVAKPADGTPRRSGWSQHPAAAPLEWVDPFTDETPAVGGAPNAAAARPTEDPHVAAAGPIAIDTSELGLLVVSYNESVRDVGLAVSAWREPGTAELEDVARRLAALEGDRSFLELYRSGLTEADRARLPVSPSLGVLGELVRRQAASRLSMLPAGDRERSRIEEVQAQLAGL